MGTAARETPASRAAVPKESRLVASGADPYGALSCFFHFIRVIVVPTGPGATRPATNPRRAHRGRLPTV